MRKKHINYLIFFIISILQISCQDDFTNGDNSTGKLVVDGSIENGQYAKVILTNSIELTSKIDSSKYLEIVTTRAKVTLFDGENFEILTLTRNKLAFPQHYYVSREIKGVAGKTYWLEVIYQGDTIRSQTTIPSGITLDSLWCTTNASDTLKSYIWASFQDNGNEKNYYRAFTKIQSKQKDFIPTYLSAFNDDFINGTLVEIPLYRGVENFFDKSKEDAFDKGDTILVKASTIDENSYKFWKNYEKEVFNSGNPFSGHGTNLTTNIVGGLGIWCGYNSKVYRIVVK